MALYYSQAILKLDSQHAKALVWAKHAAQKLHLYDPPAARSKLVALEEGEPMPGISPVPLNRGPGFLMEQKGDRPPKKHCLVVKTFDAIDSTALNGTYIGLTNDGFGKGLFYQNGPTHNTAFFEIPHGAFFTVTGTKNAYLSDMATVLVEKVPDTIYRNLYLSPAWRLPLDLYFDFEKPTARFPADTVTNLTYEDTWLDYHQRIEAFIEGQVEGPGPGEKAEALSRVGLFYAYEIDANFLGLNSLCGLLGNYLETGKKITLVLEGHAGQMENPANAHALISRRFKSLENYFFNYKNGALRKWLEKGSLVLERKYIVPKKSIYPSENGTVEKGLSIFDPPAARLRKIVIRSVEVE